MVYREFVISIYIDSYYLSMYLSIISQFSGVRLLLVAGQSLQYAFSQNATNQSGLLAIPEFQPRDDSFGAENENTEISKEPEPGPVTDRIAGAQIEFEPMDVLGDQGYYDVSNFALNTMETSELCPTGNCEYDLEGGQLNPDYAGDRTFSGKLRIDDGESTKIMNPCKLAYYRRKRGRER